jgi:hypothetical protein
LANAAIWINIFIIIMTMAVVPGEGPNYQAVQASAGIALGGVSVTAYEPTDSSLCAQGILLSNKKFKQSNLSKLINQIVL